MGRTIALVTIGQSPRADLAGEYEQALPGVRVVQIGALDGLGEEEVSRLRPDAGDEVLVSRLRTGREVRLSGRHLEPRLQACLDRVSREADLTVLLCTGDFSALHARGPLLRPQRVLHHIVAAAVDGLRDAAEEPVPLGVLVPDAAQEESAKARWGTLGAVAAVAASPYRGVETLEGPAQALRAAGVRLAVMDCIGYTRAMRDVVAGITEVPTIAANASVAMIAREVLARP